MGTTNHGTQTITWQYFQEATAANWGKRLLSQLPIGIYAGGYLSKVTDSKVSLSVLVAEIKDNVNQISVRTSSVATLDSSTLDSGAISSATPYLVMRWSYVAAANNFVEIHALASLSARQQNDLVIGKCVFVGSTLSSFDYSDRTFPMIEDQNLRVEATSDVEMYVRVRAGRVNTGNAIVKVGDQKVGPFVVPGAGLSRIDLVYVKFDGTVAIQQGSATVSPTAPLYLGKLVLAEILVVNGDTNITWDRITDSRSFLQYPAVVDESTIGVNSSGKIYAINDLQSLRYDSGWFQVGPSGNYTKTHNLGSANLMTKILFAPDSGGSPDLANVVAVDAIFSSVESGAVIRNISSSQLTVATTSQYVAVKIVSGSGTYYSSGWYKVLALRMD